MILFTYIENKLSKVFDLSWQFRFDFRLFMLLFQAHFFIFFILIFIFLSLYFIICITSIYHQWIFILVILRKISILVYYNKNWQLAFLLRLNVLYFREPIDHLSYLNWVSREIKLTPLNKQPIWTLSLMANYRGLTV